MREAKEDHASAIDTLVRSIDALPAPPPQVIAGDPSAPTDQGDYRCVTRPISETRQLDELVALVPNSEAMWPGALVRGDSIATGLFTQIVRPRAPATLSISLENIAGTRSATMEQPSLSSFREAVGRIVEQDVTGSTPADIYAEIEAVHSEEQLAVSLGAGLSVTGVPAQFSAGFDFADGEVRSRYLVKYVQAYYTVDLDQPQAPSSVFASTVTADDLADVMGSGNPPLYVSSVTFGRIVLFAFESTYSEEELRAALEFAYSGGADVSGNVSLTYEEILSDVRVTSYVLGGSGAGAAASLGSYEQIMQFIRDGGDYSRSSPGAPIAYKLAYLRDNQPARLSSTSEYEELSCERVTQRVLATLRSLQVLAAAANDDLDDDLEIFGTIRVTGREPVTLWSLGSGEAVKIAEGAAWPSEGMIGEAIVAVDPREGSVIDLSASLREKDVLGDDDLGSSKLDAAYELGWRRDVTLHLTGGGSQVDVVLSLRPI